MNKNSIEETGYLNNLKHVLIIMRITLFLFFLHTMRFGLKQLLSKTHHQT